MIEGFIAARPPMPLDPEAVRHVARLARIAMDEDELAAQAGHFDRLLEMVSAMDRADLDGVAPMHHPLDLSQPLRPDQAVEAPPRETLLALSAEADEDVYLVPKVIE